MDIKDLATTISDTEPRYSFFRYRHEVHDEQQPTTTTHPIIFIYTCPSGSKVKERMIYASFKGMVLETASVEAGLEIAKKVRSSTLLYKCLFYWGGVFLLVMRCNGMN